MSNLIYLFFAFLAIWTAIFIYLLMIGAKLTRLQKTIRALEESST